MSNYRAEREADDRESERIADASYKERIDKLLDSQVISANHPYYVIGGNPINHVMGGGTLCSRLSWAEAQEKERMFMNLGFLQVRILTSREYWGNE